MPFLEDSIYNPPQPGWRVLVMRRWPRGVRKDRIDEWFPEAAPSLELLKAYQDGALNFEQFVQLYEAEVRTRPGMLDHLRGLERVHGRVILLCWERLPRPCHRQILLGMLNDLRGESMPRLFNKRGQRLTSRQSYRGGVR